MTHRARHYAAIPLFFAIAITTTLFGYNQAYLPLHKHVLTNVGYDYSSLEIEDGSGWNVPLRRDRRKLATWAINDTLVLLNNNGFAPQTPHLLYNQATAQYIGVQLSLGPLKHVDHTKVIRAIDPYIGEILVKNGNGHRSRWKVSGPILDWRARDAIIVGVNSGLCVNRIYNRILINVEKNQTILARRVE